MFPGSTAEAVHETAVRVLVEGLLELGLLRGSVDGVMEAGAYRHLYMHRTGHWLGLDLQVLCIPMVVDTQKRAIPVTRTDLLQGSLVFVTRTGELPL